MKALVVLLFVAFALVDGSRKRSERRQTGHGKPKERPDISWQFEDWKVRPRPLKKPLEGDKMPGMENENVMPYVRWCVTNPCEMEKCKRMTTEFNYMVSPRLLWSCIDKHTKENCMEYVRIGRADIMTAEGEEIYKAGKMYNMTAIMSEKDHYSKHFSLALVKKTNLDINSWKEMSQRRSCHSGVDSTATFKSPMCSLINAGIVPEVGNVYESAGEFFKESCVPGVQNKMYNPNMTNPESLCKLCKGPEDDDDFCETLSAKEPYYGYTGTLKCLQEGQGEVGFFHTRDIMENYQALTREYNIVCKNKRRPLTLDNINKTDCQLTEEHPQVLMVSAEKPDDWISNCINALTDASTRFSSPGKVNAFSLFDSTPYCTRNMGDDGTAEEDMSGMQWMKNRDLIFKDRTVSLETIPKKQRTVQEYLGTNTMNIWKKCEQLKPKPRAFICVVGDEEMKKCKDMITEFQTIPGVKNISWGCVETTSKEECVEMVAKNMADIVYLNATEMFLAGMDHNLAPFMGENYETKEPWTESITIGVMLKDSSDLSEDMRGWKMCNAGVHKISGFLHPMGWLLANGTIDRSSSPLKSIAHHFGESCIPGMNTVDLTKHHLLSRTMDWRSLLRKKEIDWEEWYKTPLWRTWQKWQDRIVDEYQPMHELQDFEQPAFQKMIQMISSENPRVHAHHTPKIHEALEKMKMTFNWDNYKGLEDFYLLPTPNWRMMSFAWQKPPDWTEEEWNLFMMWAKYRWDQKDDPEQYTKQWKDEDWETFKKWMDVEYMDYFKDHMLLHKDTFIRLSVLCSRFQWLMIHFKYLQWKDTDIKHCREKMCDACFGQGDGKCSMDATFEDFYDYTGALKCLKNQSGDVAFIDAYTFDDAVRKQFKDDFVLLCPDGTTVNSTQRESIQECNFGRVPSHALATCNMHDGVWRWKITKALLEAQKVLTPQKMFKEGIFGEKTESLTPIPFANQTYQVWLGPMLLRAMEGIMQPPVTSVVKEKGLHEEHDLNECEGEECDDDETDRPVCDECEEEDKMCLENCWSVKQPPEKEGSKEPAGPNEHGPNPRKSDRKSDRKKTKPMGGRHVGPGRRNRKPLKKPLRMSLRKYDKKGMWKKSNMLWKPKGRKMYQLPIGMKRMRPAMMGGMGPMTGHTKGRVIGHTKGRVVGDTKAQVMGDTKRRVIGHTKAQVMGDTERRVIGHTKAQVMGDTERRVIGHTKAQVMGDTERRVIGHTKAQVMGYKNTMMHQKNPMGAMKYGMEKMGDMGHKKMMRHPYPMKDKRMNHQVETGPVMRSPRTLRTEFYTNVIFARNGTCNSIVKDLSCFGEQREIRMSAGRVGKTLISVPMCPRPTIMKTTTAQFTCNTGAGFLKSILLPVRCSYVPCNPGFWLPDWTKDQYWDGDNSYPGDYWGNKDWWRFDERGDNDNWFRSDTPDKNRVDKKIPRRRGGLKWRGEHWRTM